MKIAMFTDSYNQPDGVATHVRNVARELSKRGHEVTVYTGSGAATEYRVVNMPRVPSPFSPGYEIIIPRAGRVEADVVHVHTVFPAGLRGMMESAPKVATTHTTPKNLFPGRLDVLSAIGWRYLVAFYNRADLVICQSKRTERLFRRHGLKVPVEIISAGVDTRFFSGGKAKKAQRRYGLRAGFVLHTARLSPEKRPEWVLKACRELGIPVVCTSNGPMRAKLARTYPEARFLLVSREELRDLYAAARVYVLASKPGTECEGLGVLEAMSSGVPVVCSDVPHLVRNGENGFLFTTYEELKAKLRIIWHDSSLRKKLARNARKTAAKRDIRRVVDKLEEVYESLLRTSR
jgi:glycosyltransferase involved in cell wall biosynthesis